MRLVSGPHGAVKDGGRRSAAEAVAVMRPLLVVEAHEVIQGLALCANDDETLTSPGITVEGGRCD